MPSQPFARLSDVMVKALEDIFNVIIDAESLQLLREVSAAVLYFKDMMYWEFSVRNIDFRNSAEKQ